MPFWSASILRCVSNFSDRYAWEIVGQSAPGRGDPIVSINGTRVQIDKEFLSLPAEKQNANDKMSALGQCEARWAIFPVRFAAGIENMLRCSLFDAHSIQGHKRRIAALGRRVRTVSSGTYCRVWRSFRGSCNRSSTLLGSEPQRDFMPGHLGDSPRYHDEVRVFSGLFADAVIGYDE